MTLPKIMPSRLQRVVADVEFGAEFSSFDDLCKAVSEIQWATSLDLNPLVIGALMIEHGTLTKVDKPESVDLPPEPEVESEVESVSVNTEDKIIKTYDEGGKGKKQCSSCKKYVGIRTSVCACGSAFVSKAKPKPKPKQDDIEDEVEDSIEEVQIHSTYGASDSSATRRHVRHTGRGVRIHTPAGTCPHRLTGTDVETVENWAEQLRKTFLDHGGDWLTLSALKYFAQQFYPIYNSTKILIETGEKLSSDYKAVSAALDSIYAE
ncbi:MAG: hypothetical protein E6Q36_02810 [Chryseobacterium sp.]|nr:MAG: hypothetical protein E6Q36_02810 [Chryseobacterium sp.]